MTPTSKKDNTFDKAREQAQSGWDKTKEAAATAADKAKDAGAAVADKAKDAASNVGSALSSAASTVGHKAEDATASVGQGIQRLGDRLDRSGPQSGMLGRATDTVADALRDTGKYLEDKNLSGLAEDVTHMIRKNPIPALLLGIGLGFLLARTMRS
jgi:phage-related minor tail protein